MICWELYHDFNVSKWNLYHFTLMFCMMHLKFRISINQTLMHRVNAFTVFLCIMSCFDSLSRHRGHNSVKGRINRWVIEWHCFSLFPHMPLSFHYYFTYPCNKNRGEQSLLSMDSSSELGNAIWIWMVQEYGLRIRKRNLEEGCRTRLSKDLEESGLFGWRICSISRMKNPPKR